MKFPKRLRHRGKGKVFATIYKQADGYRLYWRERVDGKPKSRMKDFATYSEAKREGDKVVTAKAKGVGLALSPGQAADAMNAIEELQRYFQASGKRVSIRDAVGQFCANSRKLGDRPLSEAVDGLPLGLRVAHLRRRQGCRLLATQSQRERRLGIALHFS